jgi:arylsulfatase A-like enzyme
MNKRRLCWGLLALVPLLTLLSSTRELDGAQQRPPNILFLLTDDQRPDTIAALGNDVIQTPHLDRLVREGVAFTRAVCANPICTPSRAEILSGCNGFRNGVIDFGRQIDPQLATWPRTFQAAGYHTWYVGKWHNDGKPIERGYEQTLGLFWGGGGRWAKDAVDFKGFPITGYRGWVFQDDQGRKFPERGVGLTADISARFADAAIELIQRRPAKPFFLHVNFTAPHDPLIMPPGYETKYPPEEMPLPANFLPRHPFDHGNFEGRDERLLPWPRTEQLVREVTAVYYAVVSHMDEQIGRILAALDKTGLAKNTIVIFSSDHGIALGSHGLRGKQNMYEHTVGVPLVFRGPGIPRGERRDAHVCLRDLFPTACELAGLEIPATVQGKSLAAVLDGRQKEVYPFVVCYFRDKQRMIRTDRWKLINYPHIDRWQLFDLTNDPAEMKNLADAPEQRAVVADLREKLAAWQKQAHDPLAPGG